jgi:hypothetical protein
LRFHLRFVQDGEKQGGQQADGGHHDEQFDQGEGVPPR